MLILKFPTAIDRTAVIFTILAAVKTTIKRK
jgi:hypothetical protein